MDNVYLKKWANFFKFLNGFFRKKIGKKLLWFVLPDKIHLISSS